MKRPKQLPFVERKGASAAAIALAGVTPAGVSTNLVGKRPAPICRLLAEYGCK